MNTATSGTQRELELRGQTVVVIGGSAGIGLETARRARAEGADVILAARNPARLQRGAPRPSTPTIRLRSRDSSSTCRLQSTM
jgi:NAD(P)-dependent dehydrogenase (short-subunit alcohol dehydrogenase family)